MKFTPYIETKREIHEHREWMRREAMRHYVRVRRKLATENQVVDVSLRGPKCVGCQASDPFQCDALPEISAASWKEDIALEVGEAAARDMTAAVARGEDPTWYCIRCRCELRPWAGDDVHISREYLEVDYALESETGPKRRPSRAMRSLVLELYDNRCFGCGVPGSIAELTIDHIIPRAHGGDAAFRNLQPLCRACQQKKADSSGEELGVHDTLYFDGPPSDAYDGLFW